jgi:hypothetical protein
MTEVDASPVDATSGTGAGYMAFLDYAEKKGEVPAAGAELAWCVAQGLGD